jgi:hypothetical protein
MAGAGTFSARLRRIGALFAVGCAGVPALLAPSLANAAPSATAAPRCASCSTTSCSAVEKASSAGREPRARAGRLLSHASAANTGVPGSDTAVIYSNFPTQDKQHIAQWKKVLEGENYKVTEFLSTDTGAGTATLANFVSGVKAGVFIISSHGTDDGFNGLLVSEFTSQAALNSAWNTDEKNRAYRNGVLKKLNFVDNHRGITVYSLWITQKGVQQLFGDSKERPADQLIFDGSCFSNHLAASFGSTAYFGYTQPVTDAECYHDLGLILGRLDGTLDRATDRDSTSAWDAGGFTNTDTNQLAYHAKPATDSVVLAPDVSRIVYPDGQDYSLPGPAGPFKIVFDAAMDTAVAPYTFLSAKGATISNDEWTSSTELTLFLKQPSCSDVCPVTLTIASRIAVSGGVFHNWLDGNQDPAGGRAGEYPNGDNEDIPFGFASWHQQTAAATNPLCTGLYSVAVGSPTDAWAVGSQAVTSCLPLETLTEHWNGTSWTAVPSYSPASPAEDHLFGVTVAGPKDYWAVGFTQVPPKYGGDALIEHSSGSNWTGEERASGFAAELFSVSAANPNDVWAVGYGEAAEFDNTTPMVMHYDGKSWAIEPEPTAGDDGGQTELLSVDAINSTDIWAAGYTWNASNSKVRVVMLHSTGGAFTNVALGGTTSSTTYTQIDSISAVSSADVWAVGYVDDEVPLIEHYDGTTWTEVSSGLPKGDILNAVTATNVDNAWAVATSYTTEQQVLIHWDGTKWSQVLAPAVKGALVYGLATSKSGYAVGVGAVDEDSGFIEAFTPATGAAPRFSEPRPWHHL